MEPNRLNTVIALFIALLLGCFALAGYADTQGTPPKWATDQLKLRDLIKQQMYETIEWINPDGSLYSYLNVYKWDDEPEIFYYWLIYYQLTGDENIYKTVKGIAMTYLRRAKSMFDHGYYRDPFYDTEHTLEGLILLGNLAYLKPSDIEVRSALEDLVEHAGNFVPGYAEWFDPDSRHMKSLRPGTVSVKSGCPTGVDWIFNLQFVKLALAAYHSSQNERYFDWANSYLDGWITTLERNERENGYYLFPSEIDPLTGKIGPCSGVWYYGSYEPGWGWAEKGNNANRDGRGAFLDFFFLTNEREYLDAIKKQVRTLFQKGSNNQPAHYFDGKKWTPETDKVTVNMAVQCSLWDGEPDSYFDNFIDNWYKNLRYPPSEMHFWSYRKFGGLNKIDEINGYAIHNATARLEELRALTELPGEPDDFPTVGGTWGISLVPFGGINTPRGEMPWAEVMYFKPDGSMGLPDGVAALIEKGNRSQKVVSLCNTTSKEQIIAIQPDFIPSFIRNVRMNGIVSNEFDHHRAQVKIPAGQTIQVELDVVSSDKLPPQPPKGLTLSIFGN